MRKPLRSTISGPYKYIHPSVSPRSSISDTSTVREVVRYDTAKLGFCGKSLPPSTIHHPPNKSNSMLHLSRQLNSILWKNWLLKKAHPWSTFAEIMLPVVFMALLILIKLVTTKYDSPNIAFYCGNTFPVSSVFLIFFYT
jgi:hypothetical protein